MGSVTSLELARARRRVNELNDVIDRFTRIATEAHGSAIILETAKFHFIDSLSPQIRADLGY